MGLLFDCLFFVQYFLVTCFDNSSRFCCSFRRSLCCSLHVSPIICKMFTLRGENNEGEEELTGQYRAGVRNCDCGANWKWSTRGFLDFCLASIDKDTFFGVNISYYFQQLNKQSETWHSFYKGKIKISIQISWSWSVC